MLGRATLAPAARRDRGARARRRAPIRRRSPTRRRRRRRPHLAQAFIQYGLAFTGEFVLAPGPICNFAGAPPCIFGTGGGLDAARRPALAGPFVFRRAYEFSKMDSSAALSPRHPPAAPRRGPLLPLRPAAAREPYFGATVGAAGYGNVWGIDTGGPLFGVALRRRVPALDGRVLGHRRFRTAAIFFAALHRLRQHERPPGPTCSGPGFAHLIGLDLILETRDPF